MKKALAVLFIVVMVLCPLTAATHKTSGENRSYVGFAVGYNGVRDSLITILVKAIAAIAQAGVTAGTVVPETEIVMENALALGVDGYFEITKSMSLSTTAGCSVDWSGDGGIYPAPFGEMIVYGRMNGGSRGDFLMGSGLGTFCSLKNGSYSGYVALLGAMRYQLDVADHMGWWIDLTIGWNAFGYDDHGFAFIDDGFSVMPSLRTGLSYSF